MQSGSSGGHFCNNIYYYEYKYEYESEGNSKQSGIVKWQYQIKVADQQKGVVIKKVIKLMLQIF